MPAVCRPSASTYLGRVAALALMSLGIPAFAGAQAKETETVERTVAIAPGGTVTVKNFSGRVEISGSERDTVAVRAVRRATRERLDRIQLEVRSEGRNVTIEANRNVDSGRDRDNVVETDLTIEVPALANLDVHVFSSPVTIRNVTGTAHTVKSFSADLRLDQVSGPVNAETFSGAIHLGPASWSQGSSLRLKTFSGDIEVRVPQEAAGTVEFDSFSGDLNSEVPLVLRTKTRRTLRADLKPAGDTGVRAEIQLKTFSGDVRLAP